MKVIQSLIKKSKTKNDKIQLTMTKLKENMNHEKIRLFDLSMESGASIWLTTLPLKDEGFILNKQSFWDLIRFRYGWSLKRLPELCECGNKFDVDHALSCKKGGFVSLRHNQIRNITAVLLKEVSPDVHVEPPLQEITGESFHQTTSNTSEEARLDVAARSFWQTGQMTFFDVRVFNPIARRYVSQELSKCYESNEKEKKRQYNERVLQVEHGTFTPLVLSATGGMGRECAKFYNRLAELISEKRKQNYSLIVSWIRRKICFALLGSICSCLRGSRSLFNQRLESSISCDAITSEIVSRFH